MPSQYGWSIYHNHHGILGDIEDEVLGNSSVVAKNCSDGVQWIWVALRDCVHNWEGQASAILGLVSMALWMVVSIPQMVKNCRNLKGMAGVSFLLLAQWFGGDVTNLVGSILTNQLEIQVYLAVYYVAADIVLLVQFLAYLCQKKRQAADMDRQGLVQPVLCISGLFMVSNVVKYILPSRSGVISNIPITHHAAGRNLLAASVGQRIFIDVVDETGYAIGVVSSLFYIGSRLAQIIRNYKLKSTEGLSKMMFVLAVLGNLAYGLAILVHSLNGVYLIRHLPWLVGSLGVIFLDATILIQFHYYEQRNFDSLSRAPVHIEQTINVETPTFT